VPSSCRKHQSSLFPIQPEGLPDFWEFVDPSDKGKTFDLDSITDQLYDRSVHNTADGHLDWKLVEPYLQILMDNNIGSIVYDW
jgi:hypothetical protein